jgi:hypothetical protein
LLCKKLGVAGIPQPIKERFASIDETPIFRDLSMNKMTTIVLLITLHLPIQTWATPPDSLAVTPIPQRPAQAITGYQFATKTMGRAGNKRQKEALKELRSGNIPAFLRTLQPVRLIHKPANQDTLVAILYVMPDYLAIGSDENFLRIPLTYSSATAIAREFGFSLPTRKIVDAIYAQATCHLTPEPLPPGVKMRSSEYYLMHRQKIKTQRQHEGCQLGELIAGHKKDVVITNRLRQKPGRIAIYGWQRQNGRPIQPLSTVHDAEYADYSHGIRLIYQTVWINGNPQSIFDVLKDPILGPVLTYEGDIPSPRALMGIKKIRANP